MAASRPVPFLFVALNTVEDFFGASAPLKLENAVLARKAIRELVSLVRACGLVELAGVDAHEPGAPEFQRHQLPPHGLAGTPGARLLADVEVRGAPLIPVSGRRRPWPDIQELHTRGGQLVLEKKEFDLFSNPACRELVRSFAPRELILYGACAEHDVRATVLTARTFGYEATVVADAAGHRDAEAALRARGEALKRGARFEPLEETLFRVRQWQIKQERERPAEGAAAGKRK